MTGCMLGQAANEYGITIHLGSQPDASETVSTVSGAAKLAATQQQRQAQPAEHV